MIILYVLIYCFEMINLKNNVSVINFTIQFVRKHKCNSCFLAL